MRLSPRIRFFSVVLASASALSLAGCEASVPPLSVDASFARPDAGRRDGGPPMDAAGFPLDAGGADAGLRDGASNDVLDPMLMPGEMFDASPYDAGPPFELPDGGPLPDAGERSCLDPVTGMADACLCPPLAYRCGAGMPDCPLGTTCVDTRCGSSYCLPSGTLCEGDRDCAPGARCSAVYGGLNCVQPGGGCVDSRDCPDGFACEGDPGGPRDCVDRRIPCDYAVGCPYGFFCEVIEGARAFCARAYAHCDREGACFGRTCSDLDGDALRECSFASVACDACAPGTVCGLAPMDLAMECGDHGPCHSDGGCPTGRVCVDLWGDGTRTCEPPGATCGPGTCPARQICATPLSGGPPRCLDGR